MWYFYVLQSVYHPKRFTRGATNNLERELAQHNAGEVASSRRCHPYRLVYHEAYLTQEAAAQRMMSAKDGPAFAAILRRVKPSLQPSYLSASTSPATYSAPSPASSSASPPPYRT